MSTPTDGTADRDQLVAAGYRPDTEVPGWWWLPGDSYKVPEAEALVILSSQKTKGAADGG